MPRKRVPKRAKRDDSLTDSKESVQITLEALPDFFDHSDAGGKEKWAHDVEILVMEWAFFYPNHTPYGFLHDVKGYSPSQSEGILGHVPASQWPVKREAANEKLTEGLIRRHVDKMAEVQDTHISASKLGLAQALKMLSNGSTEVLKDKDGKVQLDAKGNPRFKQFRSIDLVNCMTAIEKAQQIYRRAMGLPNEEAGLNQILEKIEKMQQVRNHTTITQNIQNNTLNVQVNADGKSPADLSYDDIMLLIEAKRDQKQKQLAEPQDERLKLEEKAGVPKGDFTANAKT